MLRASLAGLTVASLAVRRSLPGLAAAWFGGAMAAEAVLTESTDELAVLLACLVVAYSVAAHAPPREALLGGTVLALGVAFTIATDPSDTVNNIVPSVLLFVGLPFAVGAAMRRRTQRIAALTLETEALAREAEVAVDAERRRIARELHDVVSHAVTLISVQAEAGQAVIDRDPEAARRSLASISQVSRDALAELGRLLGVLHSHDADPAPEPGLAQLPSLMEGAREAGLEIHLTESGTRGPLDPESDRCAYRTVQEGLTNALRHTADARVSIEVEYHDDAVVATVRAIGRAHTSSYGGSGRGLTGLRERVAGLGGTFAAGPSGEGFELRVSLPTLLTPSR